jgi:FkbM family methyltransferase
VDTLESSETRVSIGFAARWHPMNRTLLSVSMHMNVFTLPEKILYRSLGYFPTNLKGINFICDPYHIEFWRKASAGKWEPNTYNVLSKLLTPSLVYYDIGAWIGPTTIFAAKLCKKVVCFEPDAVAYQYLLWNIRLNQLRNVLPINAALADRNAPMSMACVGNDFGNSTTSLLNTESAEHIEVLGLTWETWVNYANTEVPDFLKIDVEGGEFLLLPTMKEYLSDHKPIIFLSTHAPLLNIEDRREQMSRIMGVMEIYNTCLNDRMESVSINELISKKALEHFQSYIFLD